MAKIQPLKKSHKGLLHKKLGIPMGEHIPLTVLKKAKKSKSKTLAKEANFAIVSRKWNHK